MHVWPKMCDSSITSFLNLCKASHYSCAHKTKSHVYYTGCTIKVLKPIKSNDLNDTKFIHFANEVTNIQKKREGNFTFTFTLLPFKCVYVLIVLTTPPLAACGSPVVTKRVPALGWLVHLVKSANHSNFLGSLNFAYRSSARARYKIFHAWLANGRIYIFCHYSSNTHLMQSIDYRFLLLLLYLLLRMHFVVRGVCSSNG